MVYGEQFWRPYVHVRDAARAIVAVLGASVDDVGGEVFNVGSTDQNLRKQDLVELLLGRLPDTTVELVTQDDDPRDYRVSFGKIESVLGFETVHTVRQGMDEVLGLLRTGAIADPFGFRLSELGFADVQHRSQACESRDAVSGATAREGGLRWRHGHRRAHLSRAVALASRDRRCFSFRFHTSSRDERRSQRGLVLPQEAVTAGGVPAYSSTISRAGATAS